MLSKEKESGEQGAFSLGSTKATEDQQWVKYKNKKSGHGFSAEDANALNDKLRGKKVEKVGLSNEKNGADRTVTDRKGSVQHIQTKYYNNPENTVNSAFDKDTGLYRYKKQVLEVPKDQYDEAIKKMAQKIREGKVPGVKNPDEAKNIIKKGDVTYQQARNIAKAGNIDSLIFDIKTQSITAGCAFGISFMIQYAFCIGSGINKKDALKISIISALKSGTVILGSGVLTQQFLRTTAGRSFAAFISSISKRLIDQLYKTEIGKKAIDKLASAIFGKQLAGAAAKNVTTKILRTNIITSIIITMVTSIPDFWKAVVSQRISWGQFAKNFGVNAAAVAGGVGGTAAGTVGGAAAGKAIGRAIGGDAGAVIGEKIGAWLGSILGGLGGGIGSATVAKKIFNLIRDDDAKVMFKTAQDSIVQLASDYMITEDEFENNKISEKIEAIITPKWLETMYQSGRSSFDPKNKQFRYAYEQLEPIFEKIASAREKVIIPNARIIRKRFNRTYCILFWEYIKNKFRVLFGKEDILKENVA